MDRRSDFEARGGGDRHQKKSKSTKDDVDRSRLFDVDGNVRPVTASGRQKNQASFMPSPLASHLLSNTYKGPGGLGKRKGLMYMLQTPSKDPMYEESEEEDVNADVGGGSSDQAFDHSTEHDDDDDVPPESERGSSRVLATKLPLEGRPPIMDWIPTYKNHVARYIWNGGQTPFSPETPPFHHHFNVQLTVDQGLRPALSFPLISNCFAAKIDFFNRQSAPGRLRLSCRGPPPNFGL